MRKSRKRPAKALGLLALCGATASCASPNEARPNLVREVGFVKFGDNVGQVDFGSVDDQVEVLVVTLGGGCSVAGDTEVQKEGERILITPYDFHPVSPHTPCDRVLRYHEHRVIVDEAEVELKDVVIRGREAPANSYVETAYRVKGEDRDIDSPSAP